MSMISKDTDLLVWPEKLQFLEAGEAQTAHPSGIFGLLILTRVHLGPESIILSPDVISKTKSSKASQCY